MFGVPVFAHWSLVLAFPIAWAISGRLLTAAAAFVGFAVLVLVHELGHAAIARRLRLEVYSIRLFFLHGLCEFEPPVSERAHVAVAWGGVAAQAILFLAAVVFAAALSTSFGGIPKTVEAAFFVWIPLNAVVAGINLLPLRPLDGHKAWRILPIALRRSFRPGPTSDPSGPETPAKVVSVQLKRLSRHEREL